MTCREKLMMEHPECAQSIEAGGCEGCPSYYGYLSDPDWCGCFSVNMEKACTRCWDRDIPVEKNVENGTSETPKACRTCIHQKVCKFESHYAKLFDILKENPFVRADGVVCVHYKKEV